MRVYKYYPPRQHHFDALKNGYFFFCKVSKLNDPYDASFDLLNKSPIFLQKIAPLLDHNAKNIMSQYGSCSFCEEKDNKVLWALYADNYKGFVVEYEDTYFEKINDILLARVPYQKVVYKEDLPNLDKADYEFNYYDLEGKLETIIIKDCTDIKSLDKVFVHLCCYKNCIWEKEKEWRLIVGMDISNGSNPKVDYTENGYKIPIPLNAVKSIIIGHNFSDDSLNCIKEISNKYQVGVFKTKAMKPFDIEFNRIVL